jgi:hypothetical protein
MLHVASKALILLAFSPMVMQIFFFEYIVVNPAYCPSILECGGPKNSPLGK